MVNLQSWIFYMQSQAKERRPEKFLWSNTKFETHTKGWPIADSSENITFILLLYVTAFSIGLEL